MNSPIRIGTIALCLLASTLAFAADTTKKPKNSAQQNSSGPAAGLVVGSPPRPDPRVEAQIFASASASLHMPSTSSSSSSGLAVTLKSFAEKTVKAGTGSLRYLARIRNLISSKSASFLDEDEYGASGSGSAEARTRLEAALPHHSADTYETYDLDSSEPYSPVEASVHRVAMPVSPGAQPSASPFTLFDPNSIMLGDDDFHVIKGRLIIQSVLTDYQLNQLTSMFDSGDFAHLTAFVAEELLGDREDRNRSFNAFLRSLRQAPGLTAVQINNNAFSSENIELLMRSLPALTHLDLRYNDIDQNAAAALAESLEHHPNLHRSGLLLTRYPEDDCVEEEFNSDDDSASILSSLSSRMSAAQSTLTSGMEDSLALESDKSQRASDLALKLILTRIRRIREALNHEKKRGRMNVVDLARHRDIRFKLNEIEREIEKEPSYSSASSALAVLETQIGDFVAKELSEKHGLNTLQSVIDGFGIQKAVVIKQLGTGIWSTIQAQVVEAIKSGDFTHFDPLVKDTSCELRALFGVYVYHKLASPDGGLTEDELDLSTLIYLLSQALETAYGPDGFGVADRNEREILQQFLLSMNLRLSNGQTDKLILSLERAVAYGSVAFARRLSQELAEEFAMAKAGDDAKCNSLLSIFTRQCIFDDESHKRPVVSCYAICKLALEFARSHYGVPLVIRTRLSAKATAEPSTGLIIAVYKYIDGKFTLVDPNSIPENTPVLVADALTTRFFGNSQSPIEKEIENYLSELNVVDAWLSGAVAHHQFAGEYKYTRLTESPISGFVLSQTAQLLKTAELSGTHILNPYTQLVVHSYVTTLEVALQYAGRVGGSPEDGVELKHGLYFKIQRTAEEVKRLRPGQTY